MPKAEVGKLSNSPISMYYEVYGKGPNKVLFIMGFATTYRAWKPQVDFFKKNKEKSNMEGNLETDSETGKPVIKPEEEQTKQQTESEESEWNDDYQICVFDNRGVGGTTVPTGRYTTEMLAMDAYELLQHLGWDHVHVVGISMGGMISLELALLLIGQNERVKVTSPKLLSLTLGCTHAGGRHSVVPFAGFRGMTKLFFMRDPEKRASEALHMVYSTKWLAEKKNYDVVYYDNLERARIDGPVKIQGFFGQLSAIMTHYITDARLGSLKNSGVPILILTGNDDSLVRPENSYYLRKVLEPEEYVLFEGAGHAINMECKDEFNAALLRIFKKGIEKQNATIQQQ